MTTTRRSLLRATAAGLVAGPFLAGRDAFAAAAKREFYTRARWRRLLRSRFVVEGPRRSWRMRLVAVGDLTPRSAGDRHRFTLTFRSSVPGPPQGSYVVRRNRFSSTVLFLVPSDPGRRTYQAVINRAPRRVS